MDERELIKAKINVVDLIQEYFPLKKTGVNFKANCPFHSEKTASFVVSPERGIWHCFGCGKGGDIFTFLMEKEGVEFTEALETLAKKAGVVLKRGKSDPGKGKRERLLEANQKAAQFYHYILLSHPLGKKGLGYLKSRGLTEESIEKFNLGYAPNSWDSLIKFLTKRGFTRLELIEAGLVVTSNSGGYDRFRGRIIFPLVDVKDATLGFSARILDSGEPKYVNSPQTPLFDKSSFLFGLNLAKSEIRKLDSVILVEGQMDMIMSYQAGVKNVIATGGTALTQSQVDLIKKYTTNVLLCFDTDLAGDSASRRGIEMLEKANLNIKVVELTDDKDPAELALKDPQAWVEAVGGAEPIYDYYLKSANSRFNLTTAQGKKDAGAELLPIWALISDPLVFEHYLQRLAAILGVPEEILRRQIKGRSAAASPSYQLLNKKEVEADVAPTTRRELLEEYLISLLLKIPKDLNFVPKFPETLFQDEDFKSVYVFLVIYLDAISFKSTEFKIDKFIKTLPPELVIIVDRLYLKEFDGKLSHSVSWEAEVKTVVGELKRILVKVSLEKLSAQIKNAQNFGKIEQLDLLNRRFRDLSVKLKGL